MRSAHRDLATPRLDEGYAVGLPEAELDTLHLAFSQATHGRGGLATLVLDHDKGILWHLPQPCDELADIHVVPLPGAGALGPIPTGLSTRLPSLTALPAAARTSVAQSRTSASLGSPLATAYLSLA